MGLELLEIAISTEEEFQIKIDDDDLAALRTVGDLHAYVVDKLNGKQAALHSECPNPRAFIEVRRVLMDQISLPRSVVRPTVKLHEILPRKGLRRLWDELERRLDVSLPWLAHARWYCRTLVAAPLLAAMAGVGWLVHHGEPEYAMALAVMTPIAVFATFFLGMIAAPEVSLVIPEGVTVGSLAIRCAARNRMQRIQSEEPSVESRRVFERLQGLIAEELGLPKEQVTRDARFVEDLWTG